MVAQPPPDAICSFDFFPQLPASDAISIDPALQQAVTLDLTGLKCPLPALRTAKALKGLSRGQCLSVTCTDPLAAIDIPNLVRETGDELVAEKREDERMVFVIRKAG